MTTKCRQKKKTARVDLKVFGFDVLALNLGYEISGDTSKEGRFYFEFVYLWQKMAKRIRYIKTYLRKV